MNKELLFEVTIPAYIRTYIKSNNVRAKYYEQGKKKIPLKYCNKPLFKSQGTREPDNINFGFQPFNVVRQKQKKVLLYLVDLKTGEKIIANPSRVGLPSVVNINGQAIYNGDIARFDRNNMINQIKDQFRTYLCTLTPIAPENLPIRIDCLVCDELADSLFLNGQDWDIENRFFPYAKAFHDLLVSLKIIPDDSVRYITEPAHPIFMPVPKTEDRKLIFRFYKDIRPAIGAIYDTVNTKGVLETDERFKNFA